MNEIVDQIQTQGFWFNQVIALLVSLTANALSPQLRRWTVLHIRKLIVANASMLPILASLGYLHFHYASSALNVMFALMFGCIWILLTEIRSTGFMIFAWMFPNFSLAAAWLFAVGGGHEPYSVVAFGTYPFAIGIVILMGTPVFFLRRNLEPRIALNAKNRRAE